MPGFSRDPGSQASRLDGRNGANSNSRLQFICYTPAMPLSHPASRWALLLAAALVLYWGALFVGTHLPGDPLHGLAGQGRDKLIHGAAFAGLALLLANVVCWWTRPTLLHYAAMFALLALYAAVDEWSQSFVPGRTADVKDWIADAIGITLGLGIFAVAMWFWRREEDAAEEA